MSERRDGPLCADCDQHDEEPQAPAPMVGAAPQENTVPAPPPQTAVTAPPQTAVTAPPQTAVTAPSHAAVTGPQEKLAGPATEDSPVGLASDEKPEERPAAIVPARVGCRTELRGWAGGHLHGAVRPRRRSAGQGRPPGRWC